MHGLGHAPPGRIRFVESAWRAAILRRLFSGAPSQLPLVVVKRKHAVTRWGARRPFIVIREADRGAARVARDIAAARMRRWEAALACVRQRAAIADSGQAAA